MLTVCVTGLAAPAAVPGATEVARPSTRARRPRDRYENGLFTNALLEFRLDRLGEVEVRNERRTHLHEQRLQLLVLHAGDQGLVDGVEHRGVIRDLVVDVGLVEGRALEPLELVDVGLAA